MQDHACVVAPPQPAQTGYRAQNSAQCQTRLGTQVTLRTLREPAAKLVRLVTITVLAPRSSGLQTGRRAAVLGFAKQATRAILE